MTILHVALCYLLFTFYLLVKSQPTSFSTGVLIGRGQDDIKDILSDASDYYCKDNQNICLDLLKEGNIDMESVLDYVNRLCAVMDHGVFAVFGMVGKATETLIDEYTSLHQMPFVTIDEAYENTNHPNKIRLLPDISPALTSILTSHLNWTKAYYFYNTRAGLLRFSRMVKQIQLHHTSFDMRLIKERDAESVMNTLEHMLVKLNYVNVRGSTCNEIKVILDMGAKANVDILYRMYGYKERKQSYHFLLADLDTASAIDWHKMAGGGMNLTVLRLVDSSENTQSNINIDLETIFGSDITSRLTTRQALAYDAFRVINEGMKNLQAAYPAIHTQIRTSNKYYNGELLNSVKCHTGAPVQPWRFGRNVSAYIKQVSVDGLSGRIEFDKFGFRKNYRLDILSMEKKRSPEKIGYWLSGPARQLKILETPRRLLINNTGEGINRTRIITTHIGRPYAFYKKGAKNNKDIPNNDKFDGYIVEFVQKVMGHLKIDYKLVPVKDGAYGSPLLNRSWDGMVGELIRGEADLAIADLTINSDRENVIYFSKPFLRLGISIMIKKPEEEAESKYSFVKPLAYEVWMCVGFAYVGVSVVLFLVGRFSPYEWHIDTRGAEAMMKNEFSVWNSLWFVFSTLMQQGCEVAPRAISSRIVASVWYLFTLIIISSYTANLAAFLTAARMNSPINSVEDLAKQTAIKYGTLKEGSTKAFFQKSTYSTYKKMWSFMEKNSEVFASTNKAGVERVRSSNGQYAFLIESTNNEYISNRQPCNTMKVGANLNSQGYGIGMPLDSDLKSKINIAILQLRENGTLAELEKKWWKEEGDVCDEETKDVGSTSRLTVDKIEGIFHILAAGIGAGIIIVIFELIVTAKLNSAKSHGEVTFEESLKSHISLLISSKGSKDSQSDNNPHVSNQPRSSTRSQFLSVDDVFTTASSAPQHNNYTGRRSVLGGTSTSPAPEQKVKPGQHKGDAAIPSKQYSARNNEPGLNGNQLSI